MWKFSSFNLINGGKMSKIEFKIELIVGMKYDKETDNYMNYIPAFGIYSHAKTEKQAKVVLLDAIRSFIIVAYQNKLLEKYLHRAGFTIISKRISTNSEESFLKRHNYKKIYKMPASIPFAVASSC